MTQAEEETELRTQMNLEVDVLTCICKLIGSTIKGTGLADRLQQHHSLSRVGRYRRVLVGDVRQHSLVQTTGERPDRTSFEETHQLNAHDEDQADR